MLMHTPSQMNYAFRLVSMLMLKELLLIYVNLLVSEM